MFTKLLNAGYRIYFLNYYINSQDMRNSAAIFNSASRYVASITSSTNMVASGVSMGGVIVRYALTKAENDGSSLPFYKFVSIDAPQQGAIISYTLQSFIKNQNDCFGNSAASDFSKFGLNNTVAKELLTTNPYDLGASHLNFYNELKNLNNGTGYPSLTQNIGVSFSNGAPNPNTGRWLDISYTGIFNTGICGIEGQFDLTPEEEVAGSYLPTSLIQKDSKPLFWGWFSTTIYKSPTFIPYSSSLDLVNGTSKFNITIHANANYFHDQFPPEIIDTLVKSIMDPYTITVNSQFEFDNTITETRNAYDGFPFTFSAQPTIVKNGRTYNFAGWTDGNYLNSRTIFPTGNATYTANYKGTHISNNANAFSNSSQRKFVNVAGFLYLTYESLGRIWLERSTDNGATWTISNGGKPIDDGPEAKLPAISRTGQSTIGIVYQQHNVSDDGSTIRFMEYDNNYDQITHSEIIENLYDYIDATPVISSVSTGIMIIWKASSSVFGKPVGLYYQYVNGDLWSNRISDTLSGTDISSFNPTLATDISAATNPITFNLAWEQHNADNSKIINYSTINVAADGSVSQSTVNNISLGNGFLWNYKPSIISIAGGARVNWIADMYGDNSTVCAAFHDPDYYRFWNFGSMVRSTTINKAEDNTAYFIAWSENPSLNTYVNKFADNYTLQQKSTLNTTGKDVQLCSGSRRDNMFVSSYQSTQSPYSFTTSNSIGSYYTAKAASNNNLNISRGAVIVKGKSQFYFILGGIKVDGTPVEFIEVDDSLRTNNLNKMNKYLVTEPFHLENNSIFTYTVSMGVTDSVEAVKVLGKNDFVSYDVELIDDNTGKVINRYDKADFKRDALLCKNANSYEVSAEGIVSKTVRMRVRLHTNINAKYYLLDGSTDRNVIKKESVKRISYKEGSVITDYTLYQNYPNPFNPTTIIHYQLPEEGFVTLKIFDILGREVKTLVNGYKEAGRYTAGFDGSNLSSGTYLYRLRVNDKVFTKKMQLLK